MIRQRLRGILRTTIATCIPWTALGLVTGVVLRFELIPGVYADLGQPILGGVLTFLTLVGAVVGIVNGLTFSGLVLAAERGKNIEQLRGWRVATWGAVATGGTLGLLFQSLPTAIAGGAVGAAAALAALWVARRGRVSSEPAPVVTA
jgi:hypothetical protein